MWELAAAGTHMCICSYCFFCSQFAAAVETEHSVSSFITVIHLGKRGKMWDYIIGARGFMSTRE